MTPTTRRVYPAIGPATDAPVGVPDLDAHQHAAATFDPFSAEDAWRHDPTPNDEEARESAPEKETQR